MRIGNGSHSLLLSMPKIKYTNLKPLVERNTSMDIESNEHYYDLHNNADFQSVIYNVEEKTTILIWRYPGEWFLSDESPFKKDKTFLASNDIEDLVRMIAFRFKNVTRYEVIPRDPEMPYTEDNCLSQILTFDDDDFNENVLVFEFQSGLRIKIEAEEMIFDRNYIAIEHSL